MKQQASSLSAVPFRSIAAVWLAGALLVTGCASDRADSGSTSGSTSGSASASTTASTAASSDPVSLSDPTNSILPPTSQLDRAQSGADATTSVAEVDCDLKGARLTVAAPTCYSVTVPEDWSNPDADDPVVIQAAVFHATNPDTATKDPVVYLEGGPGIGALSDLKWIESAVVKPFLATRDVIVFDQRGTGGSTPSLACSWEQAADAASTPDTSEPGSLTEDPGTPTDTIVPEALDDSAVTSDSSAAVDSSDASGADADSNTEIINLTAECHRQLTAQGVNLTAYNSIASAHDIDALRSGLGYDKVNVVGISYGTRLAQSYMRMFPNSIRAVIIDSVDPVAQSMFETEPVRTRQAIQNLFDRCRADDECNDAYPNFESDFFTLVDRLNAEPAVFDQIQPDGTTLQMGLDGSAVIDLAYSSLYQKAQFEKIPAMVTEAMAGNFEIAGELYGGYGDDSSAEFSSAMWNSVQCNERIPFESAATREANIPTEGEFAGLADYFQQSGNMFDICAVWPAGQAPAVENEPVVSEIPTLLLTGSFDPVTPPSFARAVAEHLANSTVVEFPSEGHRALQTDCARDLATTFIDDPSQAPDTSCVETVPPPQWVAS